jgi:hypothetical protein
MHQALLSFNAGEVTPYLRHRIDYEKTPAAAETMENFLAMPYGGVIKRPGLEYLAAVEAAGLNSKLFPFVASDGTRYLLHFTPDVLTVLDPAGTVKATLEYLDGYAWPSVFDWDDSLRAVQMVQINDVAFITHPACAPMRLSRISDTSWVLVWLPFTAPPVLDENIDRGIMYSVAANPIADTWSVGASYTADEVCYTSSEWVCILAHTADTNTNKPGTGLYWKTYWKRQQYAAGAAITVIAEDRTGTAWDMNPHVYNVGDIKSSGAFGIGVCLKAHTATAGSFDPQDADSGGAPASLWQLVVPWLMDSGNDTVYEGAYRTHDFEGGPVGNIYRCKQLHSPYVAGDTSEPWLGATWELFWEVLQITVPEDLGANSWNLSNPFAIGVQRTRSGFLYECIQVHNPSTGDGFDISGEDTWPGTGEAWGDYWVRIDAFVEVTGELRGPGQYFQISPERDIADARIELNATAANDGAFSPSIACAGEWDVFTFGTWYGVYVIERSTDAGATWVPLRTYEAAGDRNVADSGTEDGLVLLRIGFTDAATASLAGARCVLEPRLPYITGYALCDTYVSSTQMQGVAVTPMLSGATFRWAHGAFSDALGFPRAICLHDARLWLAGTRSNPVSLWASQTDDLINFETGVDATDGIFATLALSAASPLRWMMSQRRLFVGTALGEWVVGRETSEAAVSPVNFMARQYSSYGSLPLQPLLVNDAVFFCERKGTRLREIGYDTTRESYDSADLTRIAEHLTRAGIVGLAWQQTREPGLWVVRGDGVLLHFAYSRQEKIAAWSRHTTTAGLVRDVVCLPSDDGDDELFCIVDRGAVSCLERFPQHWQAAQELGTGWFHVDGKRGTGTSIALPAHLLNVPITKMVAGVVSTVTVTSSPITLTTSAAWQVGLPVVSRLVGLPIDTQAQDGTTLARRKRTHKLLLSLYQSAGGYLFNVSESRKQAIVNTQPTLTLRTGWEETIPDAGALDDLQLRLYHADPYPFCLRAAVMRWHLHEA